MLNNVSAINEATLNATEKNDEEPKKVEINNALAIAPTTHIVQGEEMYGLEHFDSSDFAIARIKLAQALTDEVVAGDIKAGEFMNTLTGESYGTSFEFVPISLWPSRTLFAENRDDAAICRSPNGLTNLDGVNCKFNCPHNAYDWKPGKIPPDCTESFNYMILVEGEQFPALISLMRTAIKTAGKRLNALISYAPRPPWNWVYEFYSYQESSKRGTYYATGIRKKVSDKGPAPSSEEVRQVANSFFEMRKAGRIKVEDENGNGAVVTTGAQAEPPAQVNEAAPTEEQSKQIVEFVNERKVTYQELNQMCKDEFGKVYSDINKVEAAELLNKLLPQEPVAQEPVTSETPF